MNEQALKWALKQKTSSSSKKFVLVTISAYADRKGRYYLGVEHICQRTSHNEKTVRKALAELVHDGTIAEIVNRYGQAQLVTIYQLPEAAWFTQPGTEVA